MAHLPPLPRHTRIVEREGQQTTRFADWMLLLVTAVDRLTDGIIDTVTTGSLTVTGAVTAATLTLSGLLTGVTAAFSGAVSALTLTLTGGQIVFPAAQVPSANANTLDDYEENTINPLTPVAIAFAASALNYQKIGSWVHVTGFCVFPATADGNSAGITNLPFTCENSTQARGGCVCHFDSTGTGTRLLVLNNSSAAQFFDVAGALKTNANLSGATLIFDFKYRAAA